MRHSDMAPTSVYRACLRGLKAHDRAKTYTLDTGATSAALAFAETMADGFPIDPGTAAELLEAHRLLDEIPRHPDGETKQQIVSRLLWGGDDAVDWAEAVVAADRRKHQLPPPAVLAGRLNETTSGTEPAPDSIAATPAEDDILESLSVALYELDRTATAELRAAFRIAYRTALRSTSSKARARSHRVSKADQIAAGLGDQELNDARNAMRAAGPFDACRALPDHIAAVLDLDVDQAVETSLEDYEAVSAAILVSAGQQAAGTIASSLGVSVSDIEPLMASDDSITEAASMLSAGLLEWVRDRLTGNDREPEALDELVIPEDQLAAAVCVAGGGSTDDQDDSIGGPLLGRVLASAASGAIASAAVNLAGRFVETRWVWEYGDPVTRPNGPYQPHLSIAGTSWTSVEERIERIGDRRPKSPHRYCQCTIRRTFRLRRPQ